MVESVDAYSWGQKLGTILQNGIVFGYSFLDGFRELHRFPKNLW